MILELVSAVRENIGKFTHLEISRVNHLPKTRSGKVLRNVIRNIGNHQPANPPATIEDLSVLTDIEKTIKKMLNRE
jgi:propionyl-CoA synthetase